MSAMDLDQEDVAEAEARKEAGNAALKLGKFSEAVVCYTQAIAHNPYSAVLRANRSFAFFKQESYGIAISDADEAVRLDPDYIKGYYRRASANLGLSKYKLALKDLKLVCKRRPKDADARKKLKACKDAVSQQAFANAIGTEATAPVSETLDIKGVPIEAGYDGPRLSEDGVVTVEFVEAAMERFKDQKLIARRDVLSILMQAKEILSAEPSLNDVPIPEGDGMHVTVCGDVHGQFYDVLNIFSMNGNPSPENPYLFNGDFVDRGSFSVEVILTFLAYKILYPRSFFMHRGNHESKNMNKIYGFEGEVIHKYDVTTMSLFYEVFCALPLASVVGGKVFVTHGGLASEDSVTLDDIRNIDRFQEPPDSGLMCDLLWADPQAQPGRSPSKRGVGLAFGPDVTRDFLERNGLELVVRSHEVRDAGYEVEHMGQLVTIFSAPNYCDQLGNKGAFIHFEHGSAKPHFTSFDAVEHPPVKPMAYAAGFSRMMGM